MQLPTLRSEGHEGLELSDIQNDRSDDAGGEQSVGVEVASLVAISFLCFWHMGIQATFIATSWWNFFAPTNLGMSYFGAITMAAPCWMFPFLLEVGPLFRCLSAHAWLPVAVLPALLLLTTSFVSSSFRTVILMLCIFFGYTGGAICLASGRGKTLAKLFPWAVVIGTLMMQAVKYGFSSINPVTDDGHGFPWLKVVCCLLAVAAALLLRFLLGEPYAGSRTSSNCCACLAVAPVLAGALTLNVALMTNPGMLAKYTGHTPFPAGIVMPCLFLIGMPVAFVLQERPARAASAGALGLVLGAALAAGNAACNGAVHCGGWNTIAGGAILSATMPVLWVALFSQASLLAAAGVVGRLFALAGFLVFVYVQLYLSVVTSQPLDLSGREGVWIWIVAVPAVLGLLAAVPLQGRANVRKRRRVSAAALAVSVLGVTVVALVPAIVYRWSEAGVAPKPMNTDLWTAMSFNVQGGYDTMGQWNGECIVDILRREKPDHVAFPEGEGMRLQTGSRDHIDWVASRWGAYADFGPPSWAGGAGVASASLRKPLSASWFSMPKMKGNMNRFLLRAAYDFRGINLTVFSTHTEWFGDPLMQTSFIAAKAKEAAAHGPVLVLGDFNVEPNGANNNAPNASSLSVITEGNALESVTPVDCKGEKPQGHLCRSPFETVKLDVHCHDCEGYQLDYIFYTPRWLRPIKGSARSIDGSLPGGGWCSDHQPLVATFDLTPEALNLPRVL